MGEQEKIPERTFQHNEAFKLMRYTCDDCGHTEIIWNSRDGVTPFAIICPSCGRSSLRHTNFKGDVFNDKHELHRGQRFFRDGTPDEAVSIIKRRIGHFFDIGMAVPIVVQEKLLHDAQNTEGEWRKGWPMIDRRPDND